MFLSHFSVSHIVLYTHYTTLTSAISYAFELNFKVYALTILLSNVTFLTYASKDIENTHCMIGTHVLTIILDYFKRNKFDVMCSKNLKSTEIPR